MAWWWWPPLPRGSKPLPLSPPASTPCGATLRRCFPGALPSSTLHEAVSEILEAEGLTPENTLYGQSLCSDEINNEAGGTGNLMMEHWGVNNEHFPLGGIGGAPLRRGRADTALPGGGA